MNELITHLYNIYNENPVVTTDSRQCPEGSLFFALKGERFDGNQYAAEVLQKGCVLAVVDDASIIPACAIASADVKASDNVSESIAYGKYGQYFYVPDVLQTLQQLATYHRQQLKTWTRPLPVIGITGTNGKTTTKELTCAVLSQKYNVLATEGNLNNHIGVPLTLLKIRPEHEIAIVEMGANHPMDIAELCEFVRPDFGLITNVGKAHLMGFGSFEGVISAKTKLYESLRSDNGTAFVDCGNQHLMAKLGGLSAIAYGDADMVSDKPVVSGRMLSCSPYLSMKLEVAGEPSLEINTNLIGNYNLINVVAASAVGHHFGVPSTSIKAAIEGYKPKNMRSQLVDLGYENNLILDAYNANPTSMAAALLSFSKNTASHKNLILGDMRELGEESKTEHLKVLAQLVRHNQLFETVLLVGDEFTEAFRQQTDDDVAKIARNTVRCYKDITALCDDQPVLNNMAGTTLIKGSRGIRLEKVVDVLKLLKGVE